LRIIRRHFCSKVAMVSYFNGFFHLIPGKPVKSVSVEINSQPCSLARAARCASVTRFATAWPSQHFLKDDPVPVSRMNNARAGLIQPALHTRERLIERQGVLKDARIRADTDERTKDGPAKAHWRDPRQLSIPPFACHHMVRTLLVFCIQEDVGIHEDHR